jgi:hypothetical protein
MVMIGAMAMMPFTYSITKGIGTGTGIGFIAFGMLPERLTAYPQAEHSRSPAGQGSRTAVAGASL